MKDWDGFVTRWKDARDEASLVREFCFDDPKYLDWARQEMRRVV